MKADPMTETSPSVPQTARKNRFLLLLLLASFVIPFVVGDLAYRLGWYKGGQTNHGQLIEPPVAFADLKATDAAAVPLGDGFVGKEWWLVYVLPADCDQACRNRLFQMRQVRVALGKESDRVRQVLIQTGTPSAETEALIAAEFSGFARIQAEAAVLDEALLRSGPKAAEAGRLYVMDPMGWLMLSYEPEPDEAASVVKAEDIFNDLKKLLKASRIG